MLTIFLPIESTVRELDYKINLARLFCSKGIDAIIGNPPFLRDELKYKNYRAIFLEKGANPDPEYYRLLEQKGVLLYDLADEGAAEPVYSINYLPAVESLKCMKRIFLWGKAQKEDLEQRNPDKILSQKYMVIGNPGFDLSTPKYNHFNLKLSSFKCHTPYILVNMNFGCLHSFDLESQVSACAAMSPMSKKQMYASYTKESKQWPQFQKWLEGIITSFPTEKFLIRPHPTELSQNYEKIFGHHKNVIVSKDGNVNYMIANAKLVLHKDCSTAQQSYLMGVPSISLGGRALTKDYVQWPLNFSFLPATLTEAKKNIKQILLTGRMDDRAQMALDKRVKTVLERYFSSIGHSTQNLVNCILSDTKQIFIQNNQSELSDCRSYFQKVKVFIRKRLPLHYKVSKVLRETLTEIKKDDILERLNLLESIDYTGTQYEVKKIYPNTFKISAKKEQNQEKTGLQ